MIQKKYNLSVSNLLPILLALFFQIQLQITNSTGYVFNLSPSDLLISGIIFFILYSRKYSLTFFSIEKPIVYSMALFLLIFTLSFFMGTKDTWAIKKYGGFYVLILYMVAGINFPRQEITKCKEVFAKYFVNLFLLISMIYIFLSFLKEFYSLHIPFVDIQRAIGFVSNPNIFGFLGCVALIFHWAYYPLFHRKFSSDMLISLIIIIAIYLSGSRACWVCGSFIGIFFTLFSPKTRKLLLKTSLIFTALLVFFNLPGIKFTTFPARHGKIYSMALPSKNDLSIENSSFKIREDITKISLQLIKEKPILGQGLGASFGIVIDPFEKVPLIIHNTLLWVLVEMGLIGAISLSLLFFFFLKFFYTRMRETSDPFAQATFLILLTTALFSCAHEIMYQRILWFLIGLGMAGPRKSDEHAHAP